MQARHGVLLGGSMGQGGCLLVTNNCRCAVCVAVGVCPTSWPCLAHMSGAALQGIGKVAQVITLPHNVLCNSLSARRYASPADGSALDSILRCFQCIQCSNQSHRWGWCRL